jgi:Uma2 family endonuclease
MKGLIVRSVPTGCIEVFSSEESMENMQERVTDYARMGVPAIWVVDPWRRVAYIGSNDGKLTLEETALTIPGTPVRVPVDEIFAELDRLGQKA